LLQPQQISLARHMVLARPCVRITIKIDQGMPLIAASASYLLIANITICPKGVNPMRKLILALSIAAALAPTIAFAQLPGQVCISWIKVGNQLVCSAWVWR
jgi:hypothetical protein